jgi:hypothetical protein
MNDVYLILGLIGIGVAVVGLMLLMLGIAGMFRRQ